MSNSKSENFLGSVGPSRKTMAIFWGLLILLIINSLLIILLGDKGVVLKEDGSTNPCTSIVDNGTFYFFNVSYLIIGAIWLLFGFGLIFRLSVFDQKVVKNPVLIKLTAGISTPLLLLVFVFGALGVLGHGGIGSFFLLLISFLAFLIFGLAPLLIATLMRRRFFAKGEDDSFFAKMALPLLASQSILIFLMMFLILSSFSITPDQLTCVMT